jgi:CheY-like chemotaxis protein
MTTHVSPAAQADPVTVPGTGFAAAPVAAKVLVADDDPRNLFAVEEMLRQSGLEIVLAESGEEVLRHVLKDEFAVILLDVRMPRIDGFELAAMIRARPRSSRIPILFLTAYNKDDLHVFRGYSAGAVDYVFKPIEPLILKSKVDVFSTSIARPRRSVARAPRSAGCSSRTSRSAARSSRPSASCAGRSSGRRRSCARCRSSSPPAACTRPSRPCSSATMSSA